MIILMVAMIIFVREKKVYVDSAPYLWFYQPGIMITVINTLRRAVIEEYN